MEKLLQMRRHTDKDGEMASQKGLDWFASDRSPISNPGTVTDAFCGSEVGRTVQTALAACCSHGIRARVHAPDKRFGTARLFSGWKEKGLIEAASEFGSLLAGVKTILNNKEMEALRSDLRTAVEDAFSNVREGGHGLIYIHSPIVELIGEMFGFDMSDIKLDSCEGVMLVQKDDGIHFEDLLRAERPPTD
jgi:hypothetical protein